MSTAWAILSWVWNVLPDSLHPPIVICTLFGLFVLYGKVANGDFSFGGGIAGAVVDAFHDTSKDHGGFKLWPKWEQNAIADHEKKHEKKAKEFGANAYWYYTPTGAECVTTNFSHLTGVQHAAISLAPGDDASDTDKANAERWIKHCYPKEEFRDRMKEAKRLAR